MTAVAVVMYQCCEHCDDPDTCDAGHTSPCMAHWQCEGGDPVGTYDREHLGGDPDEAYESLRDSEWGL